MINNDLRPGTLSIKEKITKEIKEKKEKRKKKKKNPPTSGKSAYLTEKTVKPAYGETIMMENPPRPAKPSFC